MSAVFAPLPLPNYIVEAVAFCKQRIMQGFDDDGLEFVETTLLRGGFTHTTYEEMTPMCMKSSGSPMYEVHRNGVATTKDYLGSRIALDLLSCAIYFCGSEDGERRSILHDAADAVVQRAWLDVERPASLVCGTRAVVLSTILPALLPVGFNRLDAAALLVLPWLARDKVDDNITFTTSKLKYSWSGIARLVEQSKWRALKALYAQFSQDADFTSAASALEASRDNLADLLVCLEHALMLRREIAPCSIMIF